MEGLTKQQAFSVLVQATQQANKAGVFELKDSATVFTALGVLAPLFEEVSGDAGPHPMEEAPKKTKK